MGSAGQSQVLGEGRTFGFGHGELEVLLRPVGRHVGQALGVLDLERIRLRK